MRSAVGVVLVAAQVLYGQALPGLRNATTSTGVFIGNNYIELGFRTNSAVGKMGTSGSAPGFYGRYSSRSGIGMVADANGFDNGTDTRIDYFLPGSPEEGFYIVHAPGSGLKNAADSVEDISDIAAGYVATRTIATDGDLRCTQQISMSENATFFENVVLLENTSPFRALTNVRFVRSHDPDNTVDRGGSYSTLNTLERSFAAGDNETVVSAITTTCDAICRALDDERASVLYFTQDPRGFGDPGTKGGLATFVRNYDNNVTKGTSAAQDVYIAIGVDVPFIAPGDFTTFTYYTSLTAGAIEEIIGDIERALTDAPSNSPTLEPSKFPSLSPTREPSKDPSLAPTLEPSFAPSGSPSAHPSRAPTTLPPTLSPTAQPSGAPTRVPSAASEIPTSTPTSLPTGAPSTSPTTLAPTGIPSGVPSMWPTTATPSNAPTTFAPTAVPSGVPSAGPTTLMPSGMPTTLEPTDLASAEPTPGPTVPSSEPTFLPTEFPTEAPSPSPTCPPGFYGGACEPLVYILSLGPVDGPDVGGTPVQLRVDNVPAAPGNVTCTFNGLASPAVLVAPGVIECLSVPTEASGGLASVPVRVVIDGEASSNVGTFSFFGACPPTACVNGVCSFGRCLCRTGWEGDACDVRLVAPVIAPLPTMSVYEGRFFTATAELSAGSTPVTWQIQRGPGGLAIDGTSGVLSWSSTVAAATNYRVTVLARNRFAEATMTFEITVLPTYYAEVTTDFVRAARPAPAIGFDVIVKDVFTDEVLGGRFAQVWVASESGARRTLLGRSDPSGRFSVAYTPFSREAGLYTYGAEPITFRSTTVQGDFAILGVDVSPSSVAVSGNPDEPVFLRDAYLVTVRGDVPLTNLALALDPQPLAVADFLLDSATLLPGESTYVSVNVTVSESVAGSLGVAISSDEGVGTFAEMSFRIRDRAARLRTSPSSVSALVPLTDRPVFRTVNLTNLGDGNTGQLQLFLPTGQTNLAAVSSTVISNIAPGESRAITVSLRAGALGLGDVFSGSMAVASTNVSVTIPVRATAVSTLTGDLVVRAEDEATYFAAGGPNLPDTRVHLRSKTTGATFVLTTNATGVAFFDDIPEDFYDLTASKSGHRTFRQSLQVFPEGQSIAVFLSRETVSYTWSVTEVAITDSVTITVEADFETFVPAPVVVWSPMTINLDEIREKRLTEIALNVTNYGLIAAQNVEVDFVDQVGEFFFIKPAEQIDLLPAMSSVIWPIKIFAATPVDRPGYAELRLPDAPENIVLLKEATAADGSTYVSEIAVGMGEDGATPVKMEVNEDGTVERFYLEGEGGWEFEYDPVTLEVAGEPTYFEFDDRRLQAPKEAAAPGTSLLSSPLLLDKDYMSKRDPVGHVLKMLDAVQDHGPYEVVPRAAELSQALRADRHLLEFTKDCFDDIACVVCRSLLDYVCENKVKKVCKKVKKLKKVGGKVQEYLEDVCTDVIDKVCDWTKEKVCFTCDQDVTIKFCSRFRCGDNVVENCLEATVYPIDDCGGIDFPALPSGSPSSPPTFTRRAWGYGGGFCGSACATGRTIGSIGVPFTVDCEYLGDELTITYGRRLAGTEVVDAEMMQRMAASRRRLFTGCAGECEFDDAKAMMQTVDARQLEFADLMAKLSACAAAVPFAGLRSVFPCVLEASLPSLDLFASMIDVILCELNAGDTCVSADFRIDNPGLANLLIQAQRLNTMLVFAQMPYGSLIDELADTTLGFESDAPNALTDIDDFRDALQEAIGNPSDGAEAITEAELAVLQAMNISLPTDAALEAFAARWNRTLDYYGAGLFTGSALPAGADADFFDADLTEALIEDFEEVARDVEVEGYLSAADAWSSAIKAQQREEAERRSGVCASVRIQISQELTLTRIGFEGTLEIKNDGDLPLTDVQVTIRITPSGDSSTSATDLFVIGTPELDGISGVDGAGALAAGATGSAVWLIVPLTEAAPVVETKYDIGGILRYSIDGDEIVSVLSPDTITVRPDPQLYLTYFFSRDVYADDPFTAEKEPSVPFYLAILIENRGYGAAFDLSIASSQPEIIENEKGLLVSFEIIGSRVEDEPRSPSLTIDFGDVDAQSTTQGIWEMVSTLRGTFSNFSATFEYSGPLDDSRLNLIEEVTIHELTSLVRLLTDHPAADADGRRLSDLEGLYVDDGLVDFLANLKPDVDYLPDTVFSSDNGTAIDVRAITDVATVRSLVEDAGGNIEVVLDMNYSAIVGSLDCWVYLRFDDPAPAGRYLQTAYRPDMDYYLVGDNAWQTAWTEYLLDGPDERNYIHLFDLSPAPQYVLTFGTLPAVTSLEITDETEASLALRWDPVVGANNYRLRMKRAGEPDSAFAIAAASLTTTEYVIPSLASGRTYIVNVQAGATTSTFELAGASVAGTTLGTSLCGNGAIDDVDEECDDGPDNGVNGVCTSECSLIPFLPPTGAVSSAPSWGPTATAMPSASAAPTGSPVVTTAPTFAPVGSPMPSMDPVSPPTDPVGAPVALDSLAPSMYPVGAPAALDSLAPTMYPVTAEPTGSLSPSAAMICANGVLDATGSVCCVGTCSECGGCACKTESVDCCPGYVAESGLECILSVDVGCVVGTYIYAGRAGDGVGEDC